MTRAEASMLPTPMAEPALRDGEAYYRRLLRVVEGQRLPLALVDLDRLETNAQALQLRSGRLPIRLGTKSIRCVEILRHVQAMSAQFRGLFCYSAREAAWLHQQGFDDLLVGYPTLEADDFAAAARAVRSGATLTLMIDEADQALALAQAARTLGVRFRVALDLDMSSDLPGLWFGVRRSPLRDAQAALAVAACIREQAGALQLVGAMGYEAQLAGLQDRAPGSPLRNQLLRALKRHSQRELGRRRRQIVQALREAGHDIGLVNGGGTGSLEATAADACITEATAGSGLYSPTLFDHFGHFHHLPAAFFALPVVRRPAPGLATCTGGGYIASGPAGADRLPSPFLPSGMRLLGDEGAGEVQTPVKLPPGFTPGLGAPLFFRHAKAGEMMERFDRLLLFRGDQAVATTPTYRGQGQNFF
jgi:D-serine deaminase-like pyridoxal phosphate-dependent protein